VKHEPLVSARFDSVLATAMDITERKRPEYPTREVFERHLNRQRCCTVEEATYGE